MRKHKIAILDMQPIDPPVGGGRLRLLGLYHGLGDDFAATYLGTFDMPDPVSRHLQLSDCLEEFDVPLSERHFTVLERWRDRVGRRDVIDVCFGFMGRLSPAYVNRAQAIIQEARVVVFSHPWVYPLVREQLTSQHIVVYDAHNFEALLRAELFGDSVVGAELVRHVLAVERALCRRTDLVLTCSADDGILFRQHYGVPPERLWDAPNGVFTDQVRPPTEEEKRAARETLGIEGPAAIFIGSAFPPNIQAVEFIARRLAPALPGITFLVCGAVSETLELLGCRTDGARNLRCVGPVTEEQKRLCLWAADIGVNPMFAGSGTNVKMFDFMAAGLPVVSTATGARGIDGGQANGLFTCEPWNIAETLSRLVEDPGHNAGAAARQLVLDRHSWKTISADLGQRLLTLCEETGAARRPSPIAGVARPHSAGRVNRIPAHREIKLHSRLGFVSTWSSDCRVARHTRFLAEALKSNGWECFILDSATPGFPARPVSSAGEVSTGNLQRIEAGGGAGVGAACRQAGINRLLVQHEPRFFSEQTLVNLVEDCDAAGVKVLITCHNAEGLSIASLRRCVEFGAQIVVTERGACKRLEANGASGVVHIPHGVLQPTPSVALLSRLRSNRKQSAPVIGSYGFVGRPKGLLDLIEAFSMVHEVYSESALLAMMRSNPGEDSQSCISQCASLLAQKGLDQDNCVQVDLGVHESRSVVDELHQCGLVVFPHHEINDAAIESLNVAVAVRKPIIATRTFRDLAPYAYFIDAPLPTALALAICNVLTNPEVYSELESSAIAYADARTWTQVARAYESLITESWDLSPKVRIAGVHRR